MIFLWLHIIRRNCCNLAGVSDWKWLIETANHALALLSSVWTRTSSKDVYRVQSQIRLRVFESIFHVFPRLPLFVETVWFILPSCLSLMTVPAVTSCCVLDLKETESGAVGSGGGLTMFFLWPWQTLLSCSGLEHFNHCAPLKHAATSSASSRRKLRITPCGALTSLTRVC